MRINKGKSMCFASSKGGVGKTINLINLAGVISQMDKKVLLIDLDLYSGNIAATLNKKCDKTIFDLCDDMLNNREIKLNNYIVSYNENIDVLASPKDPRDSAKCEANFIPSIINMAQNVYDVVLVDTNHALTDITLTTMGVVDEILFLTTNDPMDLKNLKSLLAIFKDLEYENFKILLNNSRDPYKDYFTLFDIKKILKHNIDYTLSKNLYLKDMENIIMEGKVITLDTRFATTMSKDYQTYLVIATDLIGGELV